MLQYDVFPDDWWSHRFRCECEMDQFDDLITWCYERFGDDPDDMRWTYWTDKHLIVLKQSEDALQFWMRWA